MQGKFILSLGENYELTMLLPIVLTFFFFLLYLVYFYKNPSEKPWFEVGLVIAFCISIRLGLMLILSTNPASDFLDTHLFAIDILNNQGASKIYSYTFMPYTSYLNMMSITLSLFYRIFGADIKIAKLIMVAFSGLTAGVIYAIGKDVSGKKSIGLASAFLFSAFPSMVSYTGVISSEHIALLVLCIILFLYARFTKTPAVGWKKNFLNYFLLGGTIGLLDWYRPFGYVILFAIIISELVDYLQIPKIKFDWLWRLGRVVILYCAFALVGTLGVVIPEKLFGVQFPNTNQSLGAKLYVGLDPDAVGKLTDNNEGMTNYVYGQYQNDFHGANRELIRMAIDRAILNLNKMPNMLTQKFVRIWENNQGLFFWSSFGSDDYQLLQYLSLIDSWYYLLLMVLVSLSTLFYIIGHKHSSGAIFVMQLFVLGFAILTELTEAQNRYRSILFPFLAILAALGLESLNLSRFKKKPGTASEIEQKCG